MLLQTLTAEIEIRPQSSPQSNPLEFHSHIIPKISRQGHMQFCSSLSVLVRAQRPAALGMHKLNMNTSAAVPPVTRLLAFHQENLLGQCPYWPEIATAGFW